MDRFGKHPLILRRFDLISNGAIWQSDDFPLGHNYPADTLFNNQEPDPVPRDLSSLFYMELIESKEMASLQLLQMTAVKLKVAAITQLLKENFDEAKEDTNPDADDRSEAPNGSFPNSRPLLLYNRPGRTAIGSL
jgi:hypothetical protein